MKSPASWYLPAELWSKVLRFATLEDAINLNEDDNVLLLHPTSSHKHSLSNKRSVVGVCRWWRKLSIEYLWESVGNINQSQLVQLAKFLTEDDKDVRRRKGWWSGGGDDDASSSQMKLMMDGTGSNTDANCEHIVRDQRSVPRGWWIRSLVTRFNFGDDLDTFISAITAIFPFCPNLTSFTHVHDYNGPLPTSVITSLADYCGRTLLRFQLDWGGVNIDDLIHLLDQSSSLQHIALGCTYDPPSSNLLPPEIQEANKREFHFKKLLSLQFGNSEDNMIKKFNSHLLEAAMWIVPSLTAVAIDLDARTSIEEVLGFLEAHGSKLKSLSLTDSGRLDGIPITWNEVYSLCPNLTEFRTTYNPFSNFNIEAFSSVPQPSDLNLEGEMTEIDLSTTTTNTSEYPELPRLINSSNATFLQRLCFDKWEFFPGMDCAMQEAYNGGHASSTSAEDFLVSVNLNTQLTNPTIGSNTFSEEKKEAQERSERLLAAYRRVLDNIFADFGGNLTPALQTLQFDFQVGHLDLPESCMDWWNDWLRKWRSMGLKVEGCQRRPL